MGFKEELERLEKSKVFKDWKSKNSYLAHGFIMIKGESRTPWQIGYYDKKADKITSFFMEDDIKKNPPADVFKKEGAVKELDVSKLKIEFEKAFDIARKRGEEKFGEKTFSEALIILQNISAGQVWNVSFLKGLNVLNFKIDTGSGDIVDEKRTSFVSPKAG